MKHLITVVLLSSIAALAAVDDLDSTDYWNILTSAISSPGPNADGVRELLGTIDDQKARDLLKAILSGTDGGAIEYAARGLSPDQCRQYLPQLKKVALDSTIEPKTGLLAAIARAGTLQAAQILGDVADQGSQPAAGVAFGLLKQMGSIAQPVLQREAEAGTPWERETAAAILRGASTPEAQAAFEADLHNSDKNVRIAGALGLARMGISDGKAVLETAARENNPDYQIDALVALAGLNEPEAIQRVIHLLNYSNETMRARIVWAIARYRMPSLKALAYRLQMENKPAFRSMLAEKMLDPSDPQDLAALKKMLADCRQMDGLIAAETLDKAGLSELSKDAISCGLSSANEQVKQFAAALASQDPKLWPIVASKATDSDQAVQIAALTAIGKLGQKEKFNEVARYLESNDRNVSLAAAKALASLNPIEAQQVFQRALTSKIAYVRIYSAAMLLMLERRGGANIPGVK